MGIYGALSTAVSGLRAQSFALSNISGNIANSQTTGYKRMETSFSDMIPDAPVGRQTPGAVMANSRSTNNVRGDVVPSGTATHIALNGGGFFVVKELMGTSDGVPQLSDTNYFTRRGDFELDRNGYLVNGSGYYLAGLEVDSGGNVAGSIPEKIQIENGLRAGKKTEKIDYQLNLPPNALDGIADPAGSAEDIRQNTIEGGAVTVYAADGASANVPLRWGKGADGAWDLFYMSTSPDDGATEEWTHVDANATFNDQGVLVDPTDTAVEMGDFSVDISSLSVDGKDFGTVTIDFGDGGLTRYDNSSNTATVSNLEQNGYPPGEFSSVAINDSGRVVATYSNGQQVEMFQVVTANFNAENQLKRLDGGIYAQTSQSGEALYSANASMTGSALETSNTDISEEFTKLITTQQAYSAGTRIVSTSDEMLQEALNMIR